VTDESDTQSDDRYDGAAVTLAFVDHQKEFKDNPLSLGSQCNSQPIALEIAKHDRSNFDAV